MLAVRLPQNAAPCIRNSTPRRAGRWWCLGRPHRVEDFNVGVGGKLIGVPKRGLSAITATKVGPLSRLTTCGSHFDSDAVRQFERVGRAVRDKLPQDRRLCSKAAAA